MDKTQVNVVLDKSLHKKIKILAAKQGTNITKIVTQQLEALLRESEEGDR